MKGRSIWIVGIIFAALICLAGIAAHGGVNGVLALFLVFGTVTTSYLYPFTTSPTAAQGGAGRSYNTVIATVATTATGDNSAVITHNFGLAAAEISQGFPVLRIEPQADNTTGGWFEASENPNYTVLGSNQLIAVRATTKIVLEAPHSIVR